eukprot:CAMPEP_0179486718 /NCGR_PEP_ID=MMETSP0799-20121207/62909_1 /TAXON_ID=46947 /ORGANISM="Geminigera cryophila, Strain CCMP2564" /LENGTH=183 /DNA_ID=CAMNT_0021301531 /DNA_START=66 /DNA_END=616 /DNA_ORIENTATION=-
MDAGAIPSERPKRDAAKKFLNGPEGPGGKVDGRKTHGGDGIGAHARAPGPRAKVAVKGPDTLAGKRPAAGGEKQIKKERGNRMIWLPMARSDVPKVSVDSSIRRLDLTALKRYKKHFNLKSATTNNKDDLQAAVIRHFASQLRADSGKTERSFLKFLKERKSSDKQDWQRVLQGVAGCCRVLQ